MKRLIPTLTLFIILSLASASKLRAQTDDLKPSLKVAVINSQLFQDPDKGIYKLTQVQKQVVQEFQSRSQALDQLRNKAKALEDQLKKAAGKAEQKQYDAYEGLQKQVKNESDNIFRDSQKRYTDLITPLQTKMTAVFKEWCKKRGYDLLLDIAKDPNGMVLLAEESDTEKNTLDLIKYINSIL
ncbi:MAG: OmpH family outer membrane protein [Flavihumibacter sp.]|nr:OmpH family outer membrane protein [Flavihumibacter sp.]